jgi:hypothetical protein
VTGAPAIDLIDGDALCELMKTVKIGVRVRLVEEMMWKLRISKAFSQPTISQWWLG